MAFVSATRLEWPFRPFSSQMPDYLNVKTNRRDSRIPFHDLNYSISKVNNEGIHLFFASPLKILSSLFSIIVSFQCVAFGYNCVCLLTFCPSVWCHVTPPKLCLKYLSTSKIEWYYKWRDYSPHNSDLCKTSYKLHRCTFCDALVRGKIVTCSYRSRKY